MSKAIKIVFWRKVASRSRMERLINDRIQETMEVTHTMVIILCRMAQRYVQDTKRKSTKIDVMEAAGRRQKELQWTKWFNGVMA